MKLDKELKTLVVGFTLSAALFAVLIWSKQASAKSGELPAP